MIFHNQFINFNLIVNFILLSKVKRTSYSVFQERQEQR